MMPKKAGDSEFLLKDFALGERVMNVLEKHYFGYKWFIEVCHFAGTVTLQLLYEDLKGVTKKWKYGMLLHIAKLETNPDFEKKIAMTAGELLERYNMIRSKANVLDIFEMQSKGLVIDKAGEVKESRKNILK